MRQLWCVRADLFSCHAIWGGVARAGRSGDAVCSEVLCGWGGKGKQVPRLDGSGAPGTAACMRVAHLLDVLCRRIEISPLWAL